MEYDVTVTMVWHVPEGPGLAEAGSELDAISKIRETMNLDSMREHSPYDSTVGVSVRKSAERDPVVSKYRYNAPSCHHCGQTRRSVQEMSLGIERLLGVSNREWMRICCGEPNSENWIG